VANSRSHFARLHGNGELGFAYSHTGQLLESGWEILNFVFTSDDQSISSRAPDGSRQLGQLHEAHGYVGPSRDPTGIPTVCNFLRGMKHAV